jgi:hypothetical protein
MRLGPVGRIGSYVYRLAITLLCASAAGAVVSAQEPLQIPASEISVPGSVEKLSVSTPAINSAAYADLNAAEALNTQFKDAVPHTRGAQDIKLFRQVAPSVVLILAKDALGSGSLLQNNIILTNLHVVDRNREVTVVFKPADASANQHSTKSSKATL